MATDLRLDRHADERQVGESAREFAGRGARAGGAVAHDTRRPLGAVAVVLLLLAIGAGVRAVRLDQPGLEQWGTRQYNSALLARKYEQALGGRAGGFSHAVVRAAAPAEIEPPIMESVTAVAWRLSGSEPLWFPRVLSIVAWSFGGWLLFLLLERLASRVAGIVGVAVWSFLPFAVAGSRTFQPDPLMVAAIVGAVLALVVDDDEPSRRRLVVAGLAGGFAMFVKVPAAFLIAPVFVILTCRRDGLRALWSRRTALYAALFIGPALIYNGYGILIGGFLDNQEGGRFLPHLLITGTFWHEWAHMIGATVFFVVPLAALVGVLASRGRARAVGIALVVGYVSCGLFFDYHYETHSYYHLPLVLVLAVGVALLADALTTWVRSRRADLASVGVAAATALVVVAGSQMGAFSIIPPPVPAATVHMEVVVPPEVGRFLHHSTEVVFLAPSYGDTLKFYGGVAGTWWPVPADIKLAQLEGHAAKSVQAQLDDIMRTMRSRYFVVTDMHQWHDDSDLRHYLDRHYPLVASNRDYLVYDLDGAAS